MSVNLNTDDDDSVYQGTELIITCTVTVDSAVNTMIDVNIIIWSSLQDMGSGSGSSDIMDGQYITISDTTISDMEYISTVTIRPVDTTDSASYTCTASISSLDDSDNIISSNETSDTVNVTVKGMSFLIIYCNNNIFIFRATSTRGNWR